MNYKLVYDEEMLRQFIEFLPDLQSHERYYICLFARKKYNSIVKADKASLKRSIAKKKDVFNKIRQMEVPLGSYQIDDIDVPQDSLAVYISTNPRSLIRANFSVIKELLSKIEHNQLDTNPYAIVLNEIQKSKSDTHFVTFDVDQKDYSLIEELLTILNKDQFNVIETRGGLHFLIKTKMIDNKNWYQKVDNLLKPDQKGDLLSPIPGCIQGMFVPKLL